MAENENIYCPNCQKPAQKDGNEITCLHCDAIYSVKKTGSATVKKLGPIEDHEQRLARLEALLPGQEPAEPEPVEPTEEEPIL